MVKLQSLLPDAYFIAELLDVGTAIFCFIGALTCAYLMQVILRENLPLVQLQRFSLMCLAGALMANATYYYPTWAMIAGHRPTGILVNIMVTFNLVIMAVRARLATTYDRNPHA